MGAWRHASCVRGGILRTRFASATRNCPPFVLNTVPRLSSPHWQVAAEQLARSAHAQLGNLKESIHPLRASPEVILEGVVQYAVRLVQHKDPPPSYPTPGRPSSC